jgi:Flp pilus assembly pilin Flp
MNLLKKFWNEEDGQDLIEYALLAGFIIVTSSGLLVTIGGSVCNIYNTVNSRTQAAAS